jgi:lysophospholipase L1-like esterase
LVELRVALATALAALALAGAANAVDELTYAALGDSVAAGYGLGANRAPCARAETQSYPARVARRLDRRHGSVAFVFLACSGASAASSTEGPRALATQVDGALQAIGRRRSLVSITIGINDLEWWNLPRVAQLLRGDRATYDDWVTSTVGEVRVELRRQLVRLLARPRTAVALTDYFDPVNRGSPLYALCPDQARCRARVGEAVARLNAAIRSAAAGLGPRVRVAAIGRSFAGHEGARPDCGSAPPSSAATWIQDDCLHPNPAGAAAIARAVGAAARRLGL